MTKLEPAGIQTPAPKLSGSLGVTAIVFMVVAAASPLTVVGGAAPLGFLLGNGVGFPTLFATSAVILVLFSVVGLSAMAKHVAKPGAFTYVGYGLGRSAGLAAAWVAMLTYTTVQIAVYGYIDICSPTPSPRSEARRSPGGRCRCSSSRLSASSAIGTSTCRARCSGCCSSPRWASSWRSSWR